MTPWMWILLGSATGVLVCALVFFYWLRKRQIRIIGPMFWYELVRLARRGQQPRLRVLLVSLLFVGLFVTYLREFQGEELTALTGSSQLKLDRSARFAETFLITFLSAQMLAVILITPAMVGSSITEEKERGTLDFLQSSLLTNREIILGKFTSRLAFVAGVLLAGLPVLALTSLFGGVDLNVLMAGYVITSMSALSLGAFSLWLGVQRDTLRDVLVWVYTAVLGLTIFGSCCGCIPGIAAVSPPSALGFLFVHELATPDSVLFRMHLGAVVFLHGSVTLIFTYFAIAGIRSAPPRRLDPRRRSYSYRRKKKPPEKPLPIARRVGAKDDPSPPSEPHSKPSQPSRDVIIKDDHDFDDYEDDDEDDSDYDRPAPRRRPRARRAFNPARLKDGNPFVWKERWFSGRWSWVEGGAIRGIGIATLTIIGFSLGMVLFFALISELNKGNWVGEAVNPIARLVLTVGTMLMGMALGSRTAASVAWERQKQTLDALLTIPENRSVFLQAKWYAAVFCNRWGLLLLGIIGLLSVITISVHPFGFVVAIMQITGWLVFSNTLGLWLSVCCRTVTRATVFFLIWSLSFWFIPLILTPLSGAFDRYYADLTLDFSLPVGVWDSLLSWKDFTEQYERDTKLLFVHYAVCGVGALIYWLLSGILWLSAVRRFEREGK